MISLPKPYTFQRTSRFYAGLQVFEALQNFSRTLALPALKKKKKSEQKTLFTCAVFYHIEGKSSRFFVSYLNIFTASSEVPLLSTPRLTFPSIGHTIYYEDLMHIQDFS